MYNPSTADGKQDDPTIRRLIAFSKSCDYGGFYVGNIYAYRASKATKTNKSLIQLVLKIKRPSNNLFTHGEIIVENQISFKEW